MDLYGDVDVDYGRLGLARSAGDQIVYTGIMFGVLYAWSFVSEWMESSRFRAPKFAFRPFGPGEPTAALQVSSPRSVSLWSTSNLSVPHLSFSPRSISGLPLSRSPHTLLWSISTDPLLCPRPGFGDLLVDYASQLSSPLAVFSMYGLDYSEDMSPVKTFGDVVADYEITLLPAPTRTEIEEETLSNLRLTLWSGKDWLVKFASRSLQRFANATKPLVNWGEAAVRSLWGIVWGVASRLVQYALQFLRSFQDTALYLLRDGITALCNLQKAVLREIIQFEHSAFSLLQRLWHPNSFSLADFPCTHITYHRKEVHKPDDRYTLYWKTYRSIGPVQCIFNRLLDKIFRREPTCTMGSPKPMWWAHVIATFLMGYSASEAIGVYIRFISTSPKFVAIAYTLANSLLLDQFEWTFYGYRLAGIITSQFLCWIAYRKDLARKAKRAALNQLNGRHSEPALSPEERRHRRANSLVRQIVACKRSAGHDTEEIDWAWLEFADEKRVRAVEAQWAAELARFEAAEAHRELAVRAIGLKIQVVNKQNQIAGVEDRVAEVDFDDWYFLSGRVLRVRTAELEYKKRNLVWEELTREAREAREAQGG